MRNVAAIEKRHEEPDHKLLANIKEGTVYAKATKTIWICRNCGHVVVSETAPEVCPTCLHPKAYFEMLSENF